MALKRRPGITKAEAAKKALEMNGIEYVPPEKGVTYKIHIMGEYVTVRRIVLSKKKWTPVNKYRVYKGFIENR